ncbi:hypothetical protein LMH87_005958 [Akanthomyces muscarius]|uniref:C2H2-type domain-containing protein n=1 Tax=Akanthomyces muscarius TaxID=2231603 RepID=A0A9W8QMY0_AKAMU|nr:hypothetical protein LMH87_005958 [Akanthomyces muscarius]KAJ4164280.1 hypothetical protein LMH87_005958 [Akanthomyces muscarius]
MDVLVNLRESHLRAILIALCDDLHTRRKVVDMANKLVTAPSNCGGSDQAICVQCSQAFSVLARPENRCRFHPGSMNADYDDETWADTDEKTWGPIETEENMEEWPDAFIWDCLAINAALTLLLFPANNARGDY